MAHYDDGYIWPQEQHNNLDLVAYQNSVSYISDESYGLDSYDAYNVSHEPKFVDYYHFSNDYGSYCDYEYAYGHTTIPEINYFAHNYVVEPKLNMYKPEKCDTGHVPYHTQYLISYSEIDSGFNEPEFEEYDPTPYGGGYDIVSVYGKPLPPSNRTCYPHSNPKPNDPKPDPKPTLTSIAAPNPIVEPMHEPQNKHEPKSGPEQHVQVPVVMASPCPVPTPAPFVDPESEPVTALVPAASLQLTEATERETKDYTYSDGAYDYPWPEYDNGYGIGVGYDYGYGKQIVKIPPYEYNSEVVDLCENIFGSWPCLARIREQQMRNDPAAITGPENVHRNQWEDCVNYIFGGPNPSYNQ
ncbi:hypothetical protein Tco_0415656 [Tanacetum coccineum]